MIQKLMERHPRDSIQSKAEKLGIRYEFKPKQWTKKEGKFLLNNYSKLGTKIPELLKTRTAKAIMQRARILDIVFEGEPEKKYDISKEVLNDLYLVQKKSSNTIAKKYGCSVDTIRSRMIEYGIPYRSRRESAIISKGGLSHVKLNDYVKQVLDGVMISDGYIGIVGKIDTITGSLTVNQAEKNEDWINNLCTIFNKNGLSCKIFKIKTKLLDKVYRQLSLQSLSYVELGDERKRWYKERKKIVPKDINFTPVFLAHWYMGDGYLSTEHRKKLNKNYYKVGLCTDCFTKQENDYLAKSLNKKYGYHFRVVKHKKTYRLEIAQIPEIQNFLYKISPYVVDGFQYKLKALYDLKASIGRKHWTKKQDEILRREYPIHGKHIPSLIRQGKTIVAIKNRVHQLGIKHERRYWTDEMIQILKEKYPELGTEIPELLELGKTQNAIKERARLLDIRYKYHKNQFGNVKKN